MHSPLLNNILLRTSWDRSWKSIGAAGDGEKLRSCLIAAYSETHRKYHNIQHLNDCLVLLQENLGATGQAAAIEVALWFHDAVFDVKANDNEARSAAWAVDELQQAGVAVDHIAHIKDLILATSHLASPQGQDQMLLVDIDLAILGAKRARFEEYESQIRAEYDWVPEDIFHRGRLKVLQEFLSRDAIYNTSKLHGLLEDQARANLAYAIQQLGDAEQK